MNNDELKNKMVEILKETEYEWTEEKNGYILQIFYDKLADALIAAGIEIKRPVDPTYDELLGQVKMLASEEQEQRSRAEKAEHRVEVAERALYIACFNYAKLRYVNGINDMLAVEYANKYKEQAEKELVEERKDENI